MKQVVIENPVLNSPYEVPARHFRFTEDGITDEIVESRRSSAYFIPIAKPKKKGKQLQFETEWTQDRVEENRFINQVRAKVDHWRQGKNYVGITNTTRSLLDYWTNPAREKKWVPAVNNHGGFGRWAFIEIDDPWDAQTTIRKAASSC